MRYKFTLLLVLGIVLLQAQPKTKKIKDYNPIRHKGLWSSVEYCVLEHDPDIKHGLSQMFDVDGIVVAEGYYYLGERDSTWTSYYRNDWHQVKRTGKYKHNKRVGTWVFYLSDGQPHQIYNYDTQELLYAPEPLQKATVLTDSGMVKKWLVQNPLYIGGAVDLLDLLYSKKSEFLDNYDVNLMVGTVLVSFYITSTGKAINHTVIQSISPNVDAKCLEIVKNLPAEWLPGRDENGPVTAKVVIPIEFKDKLN